jgi:hypothetical protein
VVALASRWRSAVDNLYHEGGPFVPRQSFDNFPKRFQDLKFALVVSSCLIEQLKGSV